MNSDKAPPLFILVDDPTVPRTAFETSYLDVEPPGEWDGPTCPTCDRAIGPIRWHPPHRVELSTWGNAFGDLAFGANYMLVSERFAGLWKQEGMVGLEGFDPVEVVKIVRHARLHGDPPRYFRVDVVRSRAAIDDVASNFLREDVESICPDCRLGGIISRVRGLVLEPYPPPIEDLFEVRGLPSIFVASERFKDFCTRHEFRNAILIPAADYSFGFY